VGALAGIRLAFRAGLRLVAGFPPSAPLKTKSPLLLAVLLPVLAATPGRGAERTLSGPEIYERMLATYERARSYEDTGEVQIRSIRRFWPDRTAVLWFSTAFVRPETFRYEFRNMSGPATERSRYLIWRNGDDVKSWWSAQPGVRADQPFELALAAATGVSGGSSARIAALLLPDLQWGRRLRLLDDVRLSGRAEREGASCYVLQATGPDGRPVEFWVDAQTFLLRQLREQREFDGFRTETTTIYHAPSANGPVDPKKLIFDPGVPQVRGRTLAQLQKDAWPWCFLLLLALVNHLHWRFRRGSRWAYAPGLRAGALFASVAVGVFVALILSRAGGRSALVAVGCWSAIACAYTLWRRERSVSAGKTQRGLRRP
jgi:hypothetical protein